MELLFGGDPLMSTTQQEAAANSNETMCLLPLAGAGRRRKTNIHVNERPQKLETW